ncbi:hypothetical protein F0562_006539 [Nyssa sinensis]|uniref:Uncharacterized protein n=1 Tax=Nyssa sinensis TaxID=561372 RepID=A0A5J5AN62_9ASTE|nr:hypothetical protein F0562_006539 [Nyssa sinensis]
MHRRREDSPLLSSPDWFVAEEVSVGARLRKEAFGVEINRPSNYHIKCLTDMNFDKELQDQCLEEKRFKRFVLE